MGEITTPIEEIRQEKIKKLMHIRSLGVNPYPSEPVFDIEPIKTARTKTIENEVSVAGRMMSFRGHGGISFADLTDSTGTIQISFKRDMLSEDQTTLLALIDPGDFIEVQGALFKTKTDELTILVNQFNLLSKSIRPLADPNNPITDKELRFRKRYLDLISHEATRHIFQVRHRLTHGIREFLNQKDLTEVETPILQPLYGGANAQPFTTKINALDTTAYLRIASELYLKRLMVAGYAGVFDIAKDFRNEGIDQTHFPEFTMLEAYIAFTDYHGMMDVMEQLMRHLSTDVLQTSVVSVGETPIDLNQTWHRISMTDLIKNQLQFDIDHCSDNDLIDFARANKLDITAIQSRGEKVFTIFDKLISHTLVNPTWVIDYPIEVSPLAKQHRDKPNLTERFELYIGGVELMDGWSEINDPLEQRKRFITEQSRKFAEGETAQPLDEDFLEAMEYGLPPFAGVGAGIDRLTMFFTNTWSIQETILFPFKKPLGSN